MRSIDRKLFMYKDGQLNYCGMPLRPEDIAEVRTVYTNHVAPSLSRENSYRSLWLVIASQAMPYERAVKFARSLDANTIDNPNQVYAQAQSADFKLRWPEDRFSPVSKFLMQSGGIEQVVQAYINEPAKTREEIVKQVPFLAHKTASFWYLALGGDAELLTIDIHVMRQCASLGIAIPDSHYNGKLRTQGKSKGKSIPTVPSGKKYVAIENSILDFMKQPALKREYSALWTDGHIHGGLLTTLFWWLGAKPLRTGPTQIDLDLDLPTHFPTIYTAEA